MTPPLMRWAGLFKTLEKPVDFGKKFRGEPILGNHKTWRGVIFGIIVGISMVWVQTWLYRIPFFKSVSFLDYSEVNILLLGFLISIGAIFGDLFFAFIKRRLKLVPGQPFMPFDQTNYIMGAALFLTPLLNFEISIWLTLFILTFFLHVSVNLIGFWFGINKNKW